MVYFFVANIRHFLSPSDDKWIDSRRVQNASDNNQWSFGTIDLYRRKGTLAPLPLWWWVQVATFGQCKCQKHMAHSSDWQISGICGDCGTSAWQCGRLPFAAELSGLRSLQRRYCTRRDATQGWSQGGEWRCLVCYLWRQCLTGVGLCVGELYKSPWWFNGGSARDEISTGKKSAPIIAH